MIILELVFIIESLFEVRIYGLDYGVDFEDWIGIDFASYIVTYNKMKSIEKLDIKFN